MVTDRPDGLYPTVVVDERGVCLGLVYSSQESIREAVRRRMGIYQSRSRGLWVKGETSGATQELLRIDLDCDRDGPRFVVRQHGPGFCHLDTRTCWGEDAGLGRLARTLAERARAGAGRQLHGQAVRRPGPARRQAARGGGRVDREEDREEVIWEAADVLYFTLARLAAEGIELAEVEAHLDRRALKVTRRG